MRCHQETSDRAAGPAKGQCMPGTIDCFLRKICDLGPLGHPRVPITLCLMLLHPPLPWAAISFLIETGTLLHFPDTSHGLRNLYFLDPIWLSECLQRIFNIKGSRSVAKNGVIRAEDLRMLLVGTGFTQQTEEQYFQFLAKFEIALPVANDR